MLCSAEPVHMNKSIILTRILRLCRNGKAGAAGDVCSLYRRNRRDLTLEFNEAGELQFKTEALESDAMYDDIGSALRIKQLQREKEELLSSLEMYYRVFFLGDTPGGIRMAWKIGNVTIENPLCAGAYGRGDGPALSHAVQGTGRRGLVCTEMVSAKAISFHNKNTEALMEIAPGEHPVSLQIFGHEPELMAEVAKPLSRGSLIFWISIWDVRCPRW